MEGLYFFQLLRSNISVKNYRLSDKNGDLINIFNIVKDNPNELIESYKNKWNTLQKDSDYFYVERDYYNKTRDPLSLYFLTRTCYNGAIRYNKNEEFNVAFHFGRPGMAPSKIKEIVIYYHQLMKNKNIEFFKSSFECISTKNKDVLYLDPPYTNSKSLYFGNISLDMLFDWLNKAECSWFMNINGINSKDNEINISIPYTNKHVLSYGNSSFSRMKGISVDVGDYFYYKICQLY